MAKSDSVFDLLSVWPLLKVHAEDPLLQKILYTTVNWINDNTTGMRVGVLLGAVFLTLFSYLRPPETRNRLWNAVLGFLIGTPLGVCVNCAAPIFKGMLRSKRVETAFS